MREGVVDSDPEVIAAFVRSKAPGAVRIGLETGPTATWLWTELKRKALRSTSPMPAALRAKRGIYRKELRCASRDDFEALMPLRFYRRFRAGKGILKVAREVGVGTRTAQRVAQEMDRPFEVASA
jgi:hypothetical protein